MNEPFALESEAPATPAPAKLTLAQAVVQVANEKSQAVRQRPLSPEEVNAITHCFATRGKDKGLLLRTRPTDKLTGAAWTGLQPNPHKISIGFALMLPQPERDFLEFLSTHVPLPANADPDARALKAFGVW